MPRSTINLRRKKLTQAEEHELKKSIENLSLLAEKIMKKDNDKFTSMNFPQSKNALKYANEVEKLEHPEIYYHCQIGGYGIEIKKEKKLYKVCTYGFTVDRTKLEQDTGFIQKWEMGKISGQYYNEDLTATKANYINCIEQFMNFPNITELKTQEKEPKEQFEIF